MVGAQAIGEKVLSLVVYGKWEWLRCLSRLGSCQKIQQSVDSFSFSYNILVFKSLEGPTVQSGSVNSKFLLIQANDDRS